MGLKSPRICERRSGSSDLLLISHPDAQFYLGWGYGSALGGLPHDLGMAAQLFHLAAEQGQREAQYELARMYFEGLGMQQDYEEAMRLARLAAEQGHIGGQVLLRRGYLDGLGVDKDENEACRLCSNRQLARDFSRHKTCRQFVSATQLPFPSYSHN